MDNDSNNTNKRTEFYSDLPREVVEMLMNDNGEKPAAEKPVIKEEKANTNNIDSGATRVNNVRHREKTSSFMGFEDDPELDLGDEEENVRSVKESVQKSKAELNSYVSERKRSAASRKKDYSDIEDDPERISKSAELESMFSDSSKGRHKRGTGGAGLIIALIIFILLTGYFGYHYLLNKTNLIKSEAAAAESENLQEKYEELKLENMALQEEIGVLKGEIVLPEKPVEEAPAAEAPAQAPAEETPANSSDSQTYTVENGDTFWKIAEKFYGNGSEFQKILDANGLTENSRINAGDTLIIPN